ncbi:MAG: CtsR family transcriptional regulator [Syntrophomonadaceae bacterium]|nr:CtsR family transcriptional regulator [Syntrophomonadaceae bacterium]MDD3889224.1 CtsR family transcriptional regulator [Syntrophomonadaceae bacterium]MDD4550501.1 CtsR family transcriptional regulator [Syntrophomonadaceae bacterium]
MRRSLADKIEQYLKVLIERSEENQIEIQRSELAETFCCVPSQVTYVIGTRFTEQEGYLTESRRGGNGFVRIRQFEINLYTDLERNLKKLIILIDELREQKLISKQEDYLLKHLANNIFKELPLEDQSSCLIRFRYALAKFFDYPES